MEHKYRRKAVVGMKIDMAALSGLQRAFYLNACISPRSLLSRSYHAKNLNDVLFYSGEVFCKQRMQGKMCCQRRFSDQPGRQKHQISFVFQHGPFRWISNKLKLFLVHSFFDSDFDEATFLEGAKQVNNRTLTVMYKRIVCTHVE